MTTLMEGVHFIIMALATVARIFIEIKIIPIGSYQTHGILIRFGTPLMALGQPEFSQKYTLEKTLLIF